MANLRKIARKGKFPLIAEARSWMFRSSDLLTILQLSSQRKIMKKTLQTISITIFVFIIGIMNPLSAQTPASWLKHVPTENVIEWRHHIHQHPEVSFEEVHTSQYVADVLAGFGNIEVTRSTKTSVIGVLKGNKPGRTVAFRADMDALPVKEETGLAFSSANEGVSHACGHDAHTAMLLGTAATLSKMQKDLKGTVYFIFQHAEETPPGGALDIIETDLLNDVEAFFGMHVLPNFPSGHIGILPDQAASTSSDLFELTITGKGSHGSMPHLGIDPIVIGAELVGALQTIVSRNVPPGEMAVVSVGKFQSGDVANVIADKAELAATIRTTTSETRELIQKRIETLIAHVVEAHGATYELEYIKSYPAIINDPGLNAAARNSASKILGEKNVFEAPMMTASEDFSYYRQIAPVSFVTLGVGDGPANHNPGFNLDESALENGVKAQVQIVLDYLNK